MKTPSERAAEALMKDVGTRGFAALTTKNMVAIIRKVAYADELWEFVGWIANHPTDDPECGVHCIEEMKHQGRALLAKLQKP